MPTRRIKHFELLDPAKNRLRKDDADGISAAGMIRGSVSGGAVGLVEQMFSRHSRALSARAGTRKLFISATGPTCSEAGTPSLQRVEDVRSSAVAPNATRKTNVCLCVLTIYCLLLRPLVRFGQRGMKLVHRPEPHSRDVVKGTVQLAPRTGNEGMHWRQGRGGCTEAPNRNVTNA